VIFCSLSKQLLDRLYVCMYIQSRSWLLQAVIMIMPHRLKSKFLANLSEMWQQNCCFGGMYKNTHMQTNRHVCMFALCFCFVYSAICSAITFGFIQSSMLCYNKESNKTQLKSCVILLSITKPLHKYDTMSPLSLCLCNLKLHTYTHM